jgi:hypothetical protein
LDRRRPLPAYPNHPFRCAARIINSRTQPQRGGLLFDLFERFNPAGKHQHNGCRSAFVCRMRSSNLVIIILISKIIT